MNFFSRTTAASSLLLLSFVGLLLLPSHAHAAVDKLCVDGGTNVLGINGCTYSIVSPECKTTGNCTLREADEITKLFGAACETPAGCTPDQKQQLEFARARQAASNNVPAAAQDLQSTTKDLSGVAECQQYGLTAGFKCALGTFLIKIIAAVTKLFITLLDLSNYAFDHTILKTVVNFQSLYNDTLAKGIELIWSSVRDFANILIIGLFVFIAISIILGIQEFGQKKLIARVIIVATLINFSFLFTTIAINTSNLFANTIYQAAGLGSSDSGEPKIAEQFKVLLRVSTFDQAEKTYTDSYNSANGLLALFAHAFITILFSAAGIFVFTYGTLLLMARAVIFFLLLILSAAAFATYLLPALAESDFGWSGWWHALLRNAFFAPILMIFLMASLKIAEGLQSKGSIGSIVNNWNSADSLGAILSYFLILGVLWGGIYVSSHIATGTARRLALAGGTVLPAILARGVVAPLGRRFIGGRADANAQVLGQKISSRAAQIATMKDGYAKSRAMSDLAKLMRQKERTTELSKKSFDLMNTGIGQRMAKAGGLPEALSKVSKENYVDNVHKQTKQAMEQAIQAAVTKEGAAKQASEIHKADGDAIKANHEEARSALKTAREAAQAAKEAGNLERDLATHRKSESDALMNRERMQQEHDAPSTSAARKAQLQNDMQRETQNIQSARAAATDITRRIRDIDSSTNAAVQKFQQAEADLKNHNKQVQATAADIAKRTGEVAANMAVRVSGGKFTQMVRAASGGIIDLDKNASHHAREATEKRVGILSKVKARKALDEALSKDDHGHGSSGTKGAEPHPAGH